MFILKHHMPSRYGANLAFGTKHPDTIAREAEEAERNDEQVTADLRLRIWRMANEARREDYARYAADPAKRAAWKLLHEKPLESLLEAEAQE